MRYLPNILTTSRLCSPFYFILVILCLDSFTKQSLLLFFIFIFLSITDFLDGYIARKLDITSNYGKVFDPISDKILTSAALIFLSANYIETLIPSILIIFREFLISGGREFSLINTNKNISVSFLSKIKTSLQFFVISFLLLFSSIKNINDINNIIKIESLFQIFISGLWLVTLLTLYTGFQYCNDIYLKTKKRKKK